MNPVLAQWLAVLSPLLAFGVALLVLPWLLGPGRRWMPVDHPNERSLHHTPTPRSGGIAILAGTLAAALAVMPAWPLAAWLASGAVALAAVSLVDDFRGLPALVRLAAHLLVAAVFLLFAPDVAHWPAGWLGILAVPVAVLALGWAINLYNFMDGADGLSGGMAAIGFSALAAGFLRVGDTGGAALSAAIALAAVAFLRFNFHPARLFMGDVGAIPLGFLAGALGAIGITAGYWPAWFPALAFAPFCLDASITLGRRLARGEQIWRAHRQHYFQRLVRSGWTHRRVALAEYAAMAFSAAVALTALELDGLAQGLLLALWLAITLAAMAWIDRRLPARPGE
jgi:UDP-N-acetylmuramyl pentapeptide phosphotransferase/UDP-N-acetylglucosamine-1-phosphate transferase